MFYASLRQLHLTSEEFNEVKRWPGLFPVNQLRESCDTPLKPGWAVLSVHERIIP